MGKQHQCREVQEALNRLNDALCTWERNTGVESVLILRQRGFVHRSVSGKCDVPEDVSDGQLMLNILDFVSE